MGVNILKHKSLKRVAIVRKIDFDKYSFIIDGKNVLIRSAAVHYFRLPGKNVWIDRLTKLKYAGYNAIDMYLNWGFHSQAFGEYDFTGIRDLPALLQIAQDMGFYIIARPGPYINAEVSGGGFPGWLLGKKNIILRNRKNNDFVYSEEYMKYVREWYKIIIPIINSFSTIIAVQVENEYSTNELEPDYMQELIDLVRSLGCHLPIFHNDMYSAGFYHDLVDIYAIDNYSVTYFEKPWQSFPEVFAILDGMEDNQRAFSENSPMFIAELQAGWFDKWGGDGYEKMRNILGRQHLDIVTKTSLAQGVTVLNHYMGCGGTNWNNLGSTEVYTSYDFASPLTEEGLPTDRFFAARKINLFLESFDLAKTELAENQPEIKPLNPASTMVYRTRISLKNNARWLFIRNDSLGISRAIINGEYDIDINPQEMVILPSELTLNDLEIKYSTLPLLARIADKKTQVILLKTNFNGEICFDIPENYEVKLLEKSRNIEIERTQNTLKIMYNRNDNQLTPQVVNIKGNSSNSRFIFLPEKLLDYVHLVDDTFIVGPEYITIENDKTVVASDNITEFYTIDKRGEIKVCEVDFPQSVSKIVLSNIKNYKIGKEIEEKETHNAGWKKIDTYLDADYNGCYEGFFWYKSTYPGKIKTLMLDIRHCFAVYLNGKEIFSHDSFNSISGPDTDKPIIIEVSDDLQVEENHLVLLVQSMGHNKGFEDDAANLRGLLNYKVDPEMKLDWSIKQALTPEVLQSESLEHLNNQVQNSKLTCAVTKFNFSKPDMHQIPLGIVFKNPPFNKANIYLNDVLIGHYWRDKGPQTKFYMPESFYNQDGRPNTIKLVVWQRSIDNDKNYTRRLSDVNIYIEPYGVYRLTELEELK